MARAILAGLIVAVGLAGNAAALPILIESDAVPSGFDRAKPTEPDWDEGMGPIGAAPAAQAAETAGAVKPQRPDPVQPQEARSDRADEAIASYKRPSNVLVIGSFRRMSQARREAERWAGLSALIVPAVVDGVRYYRVVSAPTDRGGIREQRRILHRAGFDQAWLATLCREPTETKGCIFVPGAVGAWRGAPTGGPTPQPAN